MASINMFLSLTLFRHLSANTFIVMYLIVACYAPPPTTTYKLQLAMVVHAAL